MTALESFAALLKTLQPYFKSEGFARQGSTFRLLHEENRGLINFQKSQSSTREVVTFTLNVSVFSARIRRYEWGAQIGIAPANSPIVWTERIGELLAERQDTWWHVHADGALPSLVRDLTQRVLPTAVEAVRTRISDEALRDYWLERFDAGTIGFQQTEWLLALLKVLGPGERYTAIREAFAANASDDIERRRAQRRIALLDEWSQPLP